MFVYADNAATTAVSKTAMEAMLPALGELYGNPSSLHQKGREANYALMGAREAVARCLNASAREIYFTGCGTEADNWAISAAVREALDHQGPAVVIARRPCILLKGVERRPALWVAEEQCIGCRACMTIGCPAISFQDKKARIDQTLCVGCGLCAGLCGKTAIKEGETL